MQNTKINRRYFMKLSGMVAVTASLAPHSKVKAEGKANRPPNILFIILDELGYFELSCMGNAYLKTPNIDRMAAEGMRFTQLLAGAPVCAPTRSCLMQGLHSGHTTVRGNRGGDSLCKDDVTVAEVLKKAGYATGGFGKWGLGDTGSPGVPERHGFDTFFGYYHQVHAHTFYPSYLIRNSEKVPLAGNTDAYYEGKTFSHYLIYDETVKFIRENKDRPFFCYCPWTPPHGLWGFPKDDPAWQDYKDKPWTVGQRSKDDGKVYAAMVKMIDRQIGQLFELLKELKLDDNTIVFVCGDNGGQAYFKSKSYPNGLFSPNGGVFRGGKGNLYEGGLRIPFICRWPGKVKPGAVSEHLGYFPDIMPTLAEIAGIDLILKTDGISIVPTLMGENVSGRKQKQHDYLYWEFGSSVAVRIGNWKAVKPKRNVPFALYDLTRDVGEQNNLADQHPDLIAKIESIAKEAHTPAPVPTGIDKSKAYKRPPKPSRVKKDND